MEKVTNGILFLSLEQEPTTRQRELLIRDSNAFFTPEETPVGKKLEQFLPQSGRILKTHVLGNIDREDFEFDLFLKDLDQFFRISAYRSGQKNLVLMFKEIKNPSNFCKTKEKEFNEHSFETIQKNEAGQDSENIAEDVSKRRCKPEDISNLILELEKAEQRAKRSDAIITSFLANLSHEIRTPLNGIIGFSQYLKSAVEKKDANDEYFNIIINSGYRLLQIINDLLYYSRLKSGNIGINPESCNLNQELDHVTSQFHSQKGKLRSGWLTIKKSYAFDGRKDHVILDCYNLKEVLNRLLDNAVKFTYEGFIELAYKRKNHHTLLFTVKDTGVGIPREKGNAIFDEFIQSGELFNRKFGGIGIGLVIAKKLVHQMGGEIGFESTEGKGSCFYFSIPYQREIESEPPSESNSDEKGSPEIEQS